jgi:hypothetical protein
MTIPSVREWNGGTSMTLESLLPYLVTATSLVGGAFIGDFVARRRWREQREDRLVFDSLARRNAALERLFLLLGEMDTYFAGYDGVNSDLEPDQGPRGFDPFALSRRFNDLIREIEIWIAPSLWGQLQELRADLYFAELASARGAETFGDPANFQDGNWYENLPEGEMVSYSDHEFADLPERLHQHKYAEQGINSSAEAIRTRIKQVKREIRASLGLQVVDDVASTTIANRHRLLRTPKSRFFKRKIRGA